jgi:hypothetical protein
VSHRNDTDIFKEIYRAAEQEGWSKDKLFKTLADPSKFKKSTRYILNKVPKLSLIILENRGKEARKAHWQ